MRRETLLYICASLLLLTPVFQIAAAAAGFIESPSTGQIAFLGAVTVIPGLAVLIIHRLTRPEHLAADTDNTEELKWMSLVYDNTDEIIMVLNEYAQVLSFNQALTRTLFFKREDIIGHPFRDIIHNDYYNNKRMSEKILTRLKEVFSGNETSIICSCKRKDDNEPVTVTFRMIPVMEGAELRNILIIGGPMQTDSLTKNYLVSETSSYVLDNNLSQIFLLCHRLTRNLEDRLAKSTILMAQIALQEVFMNSIEHGNLEIDYQKKTSLKMQKGNYWDILISECDPDFLTRRKIHVSYFMDRERVAYTIRDEGKGFDWRGYLNAGRDVIERGLLSDYHGVGLQIVKNVFEVRFNDAGNEVTLTRSFSARELPAE